MHKYARWGLVSSPRQVVTEQRHTQAVPGNVQAGYNRNFFAESVHHWKGLPREWSHHHWKADSSSHSRALLGVSEADKWPTA